MVIATSCNQTDNVELLFTLFAWYSSVIHRRRDEGHACGHAQSSVPSFNGKSKNYNMDAHSYLEVTQYLQNLGLIKESFNKGNTQHNKQGNSNSKAHKAHKHQKKHSKNQCRKHPNHDHTWVTVLISRRVRIIGATRMPLMTTNSNGNKNQVKKAEARVRDVDSDADMDCALTIINLNEEVSNKTVELQDSKPIVLTTLFLLFHLQQ
jgi:ABC-type Zn2+ transport system substrate-binding protein/surface adhesin